MNKILSILVRNHPGVLSHVAGLFTRRGYNIESIAAGVTADPNYTRITIVTTGDEATIQQVIKQINKLIDVVSVEELAHGNSLTRELLLLTILVPPEKRRDVIVTADILGASVADIGKDAMTIEFTGNELKINNIIQALGEYKIKDLARTGLLAIPLESSLNRKKPVSS